MNFTWFASSYDTDDVPYRLLTMVQMAGVLVLAAGVPAAFDDGDFRAVTLGYLIMRIGLVAQWVAGRRRAPGGPRRPRSATPSGSRVVQARLAAAARPRRGGRAAAGVAGAGLRRPRRPGARGAAVGGADRGRPAGTRTTSPSATGCSRSSCSARACSPRPPACRPRFAEGGLGGAFVTIALAGLVLLFALWWLYFLEPSGRGLADHRDRLLPVGLRPLRHLRVARRAGRRPRGRRRADRAPPRGVGRSRSPTRSPSRSARSCSCCGPCTRRSCRGRSSGPRSS